MKLSDTALLVVAFVWGLTFVMVKESLYYISPFKFLFYRFSLSFILLLGISGKKLRHINTYIIKYGLFIGVALFLGYGFQTVGLQYTTPANAGFITGLSVVIVPFLSLILLRFKPGIYSIAGVACAFFGLFFLSFHNYEMNIGDFLVLLCAVSFAMHIVLVGKYAPVHDPVLLTTVQIGMVAVLSGIFSINQESVLNTTVIQALIITALFATVFAFLIQNMAQKHTPPTRAAVIFAMEPVFAAVCSYVLINEVFTVRKIVGCVLILVGMLITEIKADN
ncbi:MAG: DMT family transporter [Candidatus Methanofastidiosia archaeon]|jgi:drug/metabolite transporter (DMT)-like permease